jgi:hypothetical protein
VHLGPNIEIIYSLYVDYSEELVRSHFQLLFFIFSHRFSRLLYIFARIHQVSFLFSEFLEIIIEESTMIIVHVGINVKPRVAKLDRMDDR